MREGNNGIGFVEAVIATCIGACFAFNSCDLTEDIGKRVEQRIEQLEERLKPKARTENILGREAPEIFYKIDGERVYLIIDGQPIEEYFSERTKIE